MLKDLWIIMLLAGVVCLILSLMLFFVWRIPEVIDELSGRKAKRQIQLMRDMNSSSEPLNRFSTSEVYMGISNGSILSEESVNIDVSENSGSIGDTSEIFTHVNSVNSSDNDVDEDGVITSDLNNSKTTYLSGDDFATSYLDGNISIGVKNISVLEEQSSL